MLQVLCLLWIWATCQCPRGGSLCSCMTSSPVITSTPYLWMHSVRNPGKAVRLCCCAGAKLFYLSGIRNGKYLQREVLNLARFISVMKFRPLSWRLAHPYLLTDRFEVLPLACKAAVSPCLRLHAPSSRSLCPAPDPHAVSADSAVPTWPCRNCLSP